MAGSVGAMVSIGEIVVNDFHNYDSHLAAAEREQRLTKDVVRFLHEIATQLAADYDRVRAG